MSSSPCDNQDRQTRWWRRLCRLCSSPLLAPPASLPPLVPSKWKAQTRRERAEKRKLSPNCRISKALPARHRFPLFNLTHTASCLLNPARHCEAQLPGLKYHRREGPLHGENGGKGRDCCEGERKEAFYLFCGANASRAL